MVRGVWRAGGSPQRTPRARRGGKVARVGGPRKDTVSHGRGSLGGGARGNEDWRASFGPRNTRNPRKGEGGRNPCWLVVHGGLDSGFEILLVLVLDPRLVASLIGGFGIVFVSEGRNMWPAVLVRTHGKTLSPKPRVFGRSTNCGKRLSVRIPHRADD